MPMDASPRIAIDAMGGDSGPAVMVAGVARARRNDPGAAASCSSATRR